MTIKTVSEILFEKFCANSKIKCHSVPRQPDKKTPDYELDFGTEKVVVEVKEIERNEEELESDRQLELRGYGNATGGVPGQRVRQKIQSASGQIKAIAKGCYPSILVLYEQHLGARNIGPYHIRVAMYGLETFILAVPEVDQPYLIGKKLGARQKMTPNANTSISAVGTLYEDRTGEILLYIFHNKFAAIPLSPLLLEPYPIEQFQIEKAKPGGFPEWERILHS